MIDTHCHLQFNAYKDDSEVVYQRCRDKGMLLNVVGSQIDTSMRAVEFAEAHEGVYATIGLHPVHLFSTEVDEGEVTFKSREEKFDYSAYRKLAEHEKTIAIGECGLELFHLPPDADRGEIVKVQKSAFREQCQLAHDLNLPLVIHVRDAYVEILEAIREFKKEGLNVRGVIHCYTSNWTNAQQFLDLGFYLGFTGVVTFPAKKTNPIPQNELIEVVKNCPLDRILIETDAPYLAPQKYRGERAEPWMVEEVAMKIAEFRGMTVSEIEKITDENAHRLFTKMK